MLNLISAIHGTGVAASTNSYESISTVTVGAGGSSSISFSSIPSTFKHLQIRCISRQNLANTGVDWLNLTMNSDTGSNYSYHYLLGDGASASAGAGTSTTKILCALGNPSNNQTASIFGATIIDILDYQDTNKYKTARILNGLSNNSSSENYVTFSSGSWRSTSAVNALTITNNSGTNSFVQYSSFALYGIKG